MIEKKLKDLTIALNVMYAKEEKMFPAYVSKHNSNCKKTSYSFNYSKWSRMALSCIKKPSALDRGIKFQHHGDFYYLNRIHYFIKENKRESDE